MVKKHRILPVYHKKRSVFYLNGNYVKKINLSKMASEGRAEVLLKIWRDNTVKYAENKT